MTRQFCRLAAATALALVVVLSGPQNHAHAQTWPDRSVKWILPFGAGSATDIAARLLAERLSAKWGKPVVMTEIGYPTQADAAARPYEVVPGEPEDQGAQATAYEAAFRAFADQDWFQGMSWWSWRGDPGDGENLSIDYTPQDKKAESILASGQGGSRP